MASRKKSLDTTADNVADASGKQPNEPHASVTYWMNEINAARKREKDWRKEGERILEIYGGDKKSSTPFNILFSNTETELPALYSAVPRPVVQRRFKDDDPLGKAASVAGQRMLEFLVDTNIEGYETFDEGTRAATLDALLPGRGVTCVKYDAEVNDRAEVPAVPATATTPAVAAVPAESYKGAELICIETRSWNRVFHGFARKWSKVPWLAFEEHIDKDEALRLFGKAVADKLVFTTGEDVDRDEEKKTEDERNLGERKTSCIYQIWDKDGGRKVRYVCGQYPEAMLKEEDDPLEMTGFFPIPKPMRFIEKPNSLEPVAPYQIYENQAKELNDLTRRISKIVNAIRARGVYDSELGEDIKNLMTADDNQLVPADKSSSLAAEKGLQNAIWFAPIDVLVATLRELLVARENCKRVIYEITGISDIVRGATVASETATAQEIKSQWGTLRLKRRQKEVQRYARDLLRMMLELAASKFDEETWAKMTGLPFLLSAKFNELTQVAAALKTKLAMMAAQVQAAGQDISQVPQPPELQQLQQVTQALQTPQWSQVLATLRDDMQRAYRIDIETNSTVEPEAAEDQKNISEMMTAMGQYLNGVGPLVAKGVMPFGAAQSMLLAIARRFRFGTEIEEYIKAMQAPKPEDDGKAAEALAMKEQQIKKDAEVAQGKTAAFAQIEKLNGELAAEKQQAALDKRASEIARKEDDLKRREEILAIQQAADAKCKAAEDKATTAQKDLHAERAGSKLEKVGMQADHKQQQMASKEKSADTARQLSAGIVTKELKPVLDMLKKLGERVGGFEAKLGELMEAAAAPRMIERGEDGRAKSVGGRPVIRDESGRAMGLQ